MSSLAIVPASTGVSNSQFWPHSISVNEFCDIAGISRRTYSRLRAEGDGPQVTWIRGKQVITHDSVQRWYDRRTERVGQPGILPMR